MLLYFFAGFVVAAQVGGRMLDRIGAKRPIVLGSALAAVGLQPMGAVTLSSLFGRPIRSRSSSCLARGMGLLLGQANTDALNQAPNFAYGEATGITQTARNFGFSLGLAVLGTILVTQLRTHLVTSLTGQGLNSTQAHRVAANIAQLNAGSGSTGAIPQFVRVDFASATSSVLMTMSWVMVACAVIAFVGLPRRARRLVSEPVEFDDPTQPATADGMYDA